MRMMDLGSERGHLHIIDTATAVDCTKDVPLRRSFRSLIDLMVPCCGFHPSPTSSSSSSSSDSDDSTHTTTTTTTSTATITFFGYRRGRVSFCLQDDPRSRPLLLLDLAVPTAYLAREMRHGLLRIALESCGARSSSRRRHLFGVPVWTMYCNGRKVGFAVRRQASDADMAVLKLMQTISVGAGVLPGETKSGDGADGDLMYLRARFERVVGSVDSESFHMINPVGSAGQELSIFLLRS